VLIRYTLSGDANLDGTVDTIDFNLLAASFGAPGKSWVNGDFNHDCSVDTTDFNLLASNFSQTMSAAVARPGSAIIPEPGSYCPAVGCAMLVRFRARAPRRRYGRNHG
jgi:hypothetical protein